MDNERKIVSNKNPELFYESEPSIKGILNHDNPIGTAPYKTDRKGSKYTHTGTKNRITWSISINPIERD